MRCVRAAMGNRTPKLATIDMDMLLNRTSFTEKQIKDWYKGFMVSLAEWIISNSGVRTSWDSV